MVGKIKSRCKQLLAFNVGSAPVYDRFQNSPVAPQDVVYIAHVVVGIGIESVVKLIAATIIAELFV